MVDFIIPKLEEIPLLGFEILYRQKEEDPWRKKTFNKIEDWCSWDIYYINKLLQNNNLKLKIRK